MDDKQDYSALSSTSTLPVPSQQEESFNSEVQQAPPLSNTDSQQQQTPQQSRGRILIVEDEKDYRDILTETLQAEGFTVLKAENGEVALDLLKNSEVDLILLDIIMPKMDGQTLLYRLKNTLKKDIPVVIITNLLEGPYKQEGIDFIIKANASLDEIVKKVKAKLPFSV